ncbi:MAG: hypothetical protein ACFLMY_15135 [Candidatus Brachytrichaceae bacterium NZ_4S206]|jgi:hypothetical protein
MLTAERLQRLLLLFSLLLGIVAAPLLLVNTWGAIVLFLLAGLGISLGIVARVYPTYIARGSRNVEGDSASQPPAAPPTTGEATTRMEIAGVEESAATTEVVPPIALTSETHTQRSTTTWLWLIGALLAGVSIGVLANRVLPAPYANPGSAQDTAPVEPSSPLVSPIRKPEATSALIESRVIVAGEEWAVLHSALDIGQAADIFDGRPETLMRGESANPFIFEVRYPQPKPAGSVVLHLARMSDFEITITAATADGETLTFGEAYVEELIDPVLEFEVPGGTRPLRFVRVAILDRRAPPQEGFHIHVREFALR